MERFHINKESIFSVSLEYALHENTPQTVIQFQIPDLEFFKHITIFRF